jgi:SAM-dependent methyltransferase
MMNPAEFANIAEAEERFWWYRGMREIMFRLLDPLARDRNLGRVLEAGAGTGHFSRSLGERYCWEMYPFDLGWEGIEHARRYGIGRFVQADMRALPYAGSSFDAAVSMDVIVHLPRGQEARPLLEFERVLKPGGILVLRVSALDILRSRHSEFAHERQRFTRPRLVEAVTRAGFRVLRASYANSLLFPVALARFRVWEPLTRQVPASGVRPVTAWLDRLLHAPLALEARLLGAGWNLPFGQSLILIAEKPRPRDYNGTR